MSAFNARLDRTLSLLAKIRLLAEDVKTDFFDFYAAATVYLDRQFKLPPDQKLEIEGFLIVRADQLAEQMVRALYRGLVGRAQGAEIITSEEYFKLIEASTKSEMVTNVKSLLLADNIGCFNNGNWPAIVTMWFKLCSFPVAIDAKITLLDQFFGLMHDSGPICDYLSSQSNSFSKWMEDALYIRNLGGVNELLAHASEEGRDLLKSASFGIGRRPVTSIQKIDLALARVRRDFVTRKGRCRLTVEEPHGNTINLTADHYFNGQRLTVRGQVQAADSSLQLVINGEIHRLDPLRMNRCVDEILFRMVSLPSDYFISGLRKKSI